MFFQLKQLSKRSKSIIVTYHILHNFLIQMRCGLGNTESSGGSTHSKKNLSESLNYIYEVFNDYLYYSGIPVNMFRDRLILEIGPGDNLGVAMRFLSAGAEKVVCLDKFFSRRDNRQQYEIYKRLRSSLNDQEKHNFDMTIDLSKGITINTDKLVYIHGIGIEEADSILDPLSFDFIVSRAVLEHVYDLDRAFLVMNRVLKPRGCMIHKIDLRDHGIFSGKGFHPLTFHTIGESVYRLMINASGKPNRRLIAYYRQKMKELGYEANILIAGIIGNANEIVPHKNNVIFGRDYSDSTISLLQSIRPKLRPQFRDICDEDLMVSIIFLVARKSA